MSFGVAIFLPRKAFKSDKKLETRLLSAMENMSAPDSHVRQGYISKITSNSKLHMPSVKFYDKPNISEFSSSGVKSKELYPLLDKYRILDIGYESGKLIGKGNEDVSNLRSKGFSLFGLKLISVISTISCDAYSYGHIGFWLYYEYGCRRGVEKFTTIKVEDNLSGNISMSDNCIMFYPCSKIIF